MPDGEARARAILDTAVDAILTIDHTGTIESVNRATTVLFGYAEEELVGRNISSLMPSPYAEQHDGYLDRYATTREARIIGIGRDVQARRRDGSVFPARLSVGELELDGLCLFTGILHDQSEARAVETRAADLGAILEESVNEVYLFDDESLCFKQVNRAARENLGYSLDELRSLTPVDIKPEFDWPRIQELIAPLRDRRISKLSFKTRHQRKDGSEYRVEVDLQHRALAGEFAAIVVDITEREKLEEQLLQSQKMEAIGTLAGGIAHDFNNLLTSIRGSSEILLDGLEPGSRLARSASRIHRAAERAAALTTQLLGFSRKQVTRRVELDLNGAVREMHDLLARTLPEDVELELALASDVLFVHADDGQVGQVLMNLVVNGGDAMPGGGRLVLATAREQVSAESAARLGVEPGAYGVVRVTDSGDGIPEEIRAQIFDPFFTTKEPGKGTGLGLSTAFGIIREHGGAIRVASEVGEGATFELLLPEIEAPAVVTRTERAERSQRSADGGCLLLVEDDDIMREMLGEVLEEQGYVVLQAADPDEALARAREHDGGIDLVITDVVMPKRSGMLLVKELRKEFSGLSVLYMSGYTDQVLADRGELSLDDPFMRKPFGNAALLAKVRELLQSPSRRV